MTIKERINDDVKNAMRAKDKNLLNTLRLITAAIKQIEVDERLEVDEERLISILEKMKKQRKESIAQFEKASRTDLVDKEQFELNIINTYLPEPLSNDEIEKIVHEIIIATKADTIADMGKVMTEIKTKLHGRADMAKVSALIRSKLS